MRICHLSDSHLGAGENIGKRGEGGLTLRQEDIISSFLEAVDKIICLKPDVCIHSGDLFHQVRPANRILAIASEALHRLADINAIPTLIITGNHDAPRLAQSWAALEVFKNIENLMVSATDGIHQFRIADTSFFAIPHSTGEKTIREYVETCEPDSAARFNVLITHGVVAGMPEFSMAELGEQELPKAALDRFDYVALGHYHNFAQVARSAYYAGSTERLSQSERDFAKGFVEVTLESFDLRFHEVTSRKMVTLRLPDMSGMRGDQIGDAIAAQVVDTGGEDKIVRVIVPGINSESLKSLPSGLLAELRKKSFALDIRFEPAAPGQPAAPGSIQAGIGRLDESFIAFLERSDTPQPERERLRSAALRYLQSVDDED